MEGSNVWFGDVDVTTAEYWGSDGPMVDGVNYFRGFHHDLSRLAAPIDEYIWDVVLTFINRPNMFRFWFELYKCACLGCVEQSQHNAVLAVSSNIRRLIFVVVNFKMQYNLAELEKTWRHISE